MAVDQCITINVVTPENVVSDILTVNKIICIEPCTTISGTIRWRNNGETTSVATDLKVTVTIGESTTEQTIVNTAIGPGAETATYPFTISSLPKGIYTIRTVPAGAVDQVITVISQANITIDSITVGETPCNGGCTVTCTSTCPKTVNMNVVWTNSGDSGGTFTPWVTIAGVDQTPGAQITVVPGVPNTTTFSGMVLPIGLPQVCFHTGTVTSTIPI